MDRWKNKVAVVTGASSGIGAACCKDLAKAGMIVVGLARREERIVELRDSLPDEIRSNLHAINCDVTKEENVVRTFDWIEKNIGGVDVLVNNAGVTRPSLLVSDNNTADLRAILDTNVMGVALCTREAFRSMKNRNANGHVVIINSIVGHKVPQMINGLTYSIYPASKYAITAMTEVYRQEFLINKTKVKVTSISPGAVDTEIFNDDVRKYLSDMPLLRPEDVSDAVMYCIQTPPTVQIHELIIKPVGERF